MVPEPNRSLPTASRAVGRRKHDINWKIYRFTRGHRFTFLRRQAFIKCTVCQKGTRVLVPVVSSSKSHRHRRKIEVTGTGEENFEPSAAKPFPVCRTLNIKTTVCALGLFTKDSRPRLVLRTAVLVAQIGNHNFPACSGPLDREIPKWQSTNSVLTN